MKNTNPLLKYILKRFNILIILCVVIGMLPYKISATSDVPTPPKEFPIYTYHTHPPFIITTGQGLSYDLAAYLSNKSHGRFQFTVKPMSRPRVNKMLAESKKGLVPWVNPAWFKDKQQNKYLWSKAVLMKDGNSLISNQKNRVLYDGPSSLDGMILGGVRGHVFADIDTYRKTAGNIRRVDAERHIDNFRKLAKQRIDVTITPQSGAEYLIKKKGFQDQLFISPMIHSQYTRRVIIISEQIDTGIYIDTLLEKMMTDPQWLKIMHNYR